jgi:hypothetical protein
MKLKQFLGALSFTVYGNFVQSQEESEVCHPIYMIAYIFTYIFKILPLVIVNKNKSIHNNFFTGY